MFFIFFFASCNIIGLQWNSRKQAVVLSNIHNPLDINCMFVHAQSLWPALHRVCTQCVACFRRCKSLDDTPRARHRKVLTQHWFSQEVKHIGSTHNRSALPFTGFGPKVVTNQYNSPSGLYSSENIQDFNSAVDEVKTMGAPSEPSST